MVACHPASAATVTHPMPSRSQEGKPWPWVALRSASWEAGEAALGLGNRVSWELNAVMLGGGDASGRPLPLQSGHE
eukprot:9671976-Alexandrium_andersonii.AAC.1